MNSITDSRNKNQPDREISVHQQEGDHLLKTHCSWLGSENLLDAALNAYLRALETTPHSALLTSRLSQVYWLKGQYEKAMTQARKTLQQLDAVQESPRNSRDAQWREAHRNAHYVLGMTQARQGEYREAKKSYRQALQTSGFRSAGILFSWFQACRDQVVSEKGCGFSRIWAAAQAIVAILSSMALLPWEPARPAMTTLLSVAPRLLLAWCLEETNREAEAESHYQKLAQDYPGLPCVGMVLGDMAREAGDLSRAQQLFEAVLNRHPASLEAHFHLGQTLEQADAYPQMAEVYHRLHKLLPTDAQVVCQLGNAYYYQQKLPEALHYYEVALHLGRQPQWKAMVAQSMANILLDYLQQPQAAQAYYHLSKTLDPRNVDNYIQLGMIYFQDDDFTNAELVYRQAVAMMPNSPRLYSNLGYLRWMEGDTTGAIALYEKALALDSHYEVPYNNLGVIYLDLLGEIAKAISYFQQALELDENYSLAYYNLGRAYSFMDNRLEAAHCFQMAQASNRISHDLDNDDLTARIQRLFDPCELEILD
jgi:tetratricopeptide (TPR) repeat protein